MDYGLPEDGSGFTSDDADANLVPELVEKVALPILHHEIVHCWDMLSTQETRNAVAATSLVTDYVPASSEALADLLVAIRTRLADAVTNLKVLHFYFQAATLRFYRSIHIHMKTETETLAKLYMLLLQKQICIFSFLYMGW